MTGLEISPSHPHVHGTKLTRWTLNAPAAFGGTLESRVFWCKHNRRTCFCRTLHYSDNQHNIPVTTFRKGQDAITAIEITETEARPPCKEESIWRRIARDRLFCH